MALVNLVALVMVEENESRIPRRVPRPQRISAMNLTEKDFISLFRINKNCFLKLTEKLRPMLSPKSFRRNAFSVETKILTALRFYAIGSYQKGIAQDFTLSMSQQSVSNCITAVTSALNCVMNDYIHFPLQTSEHDMLKLEFFNYSLFPGVIGALDCTHVAIIAPQNGVYNEENYVNRKGYHSINVQLVCDMQQKILNISARFPGSTHDSYIWKSSALRRWLEQAALSNTWLLGDSGYPLEPWLLTPVSGSIVTPAEEEYNKRHIAGRGIVERCNGTLKMRFRCLSKHRVLHYDPVIAGKIINACAVLHNMCIDEGIIVERLDLNDNDHPFDTGVSSGHNQREWNIRDRIVRSFQN